jgi:hypothetical protein
MEENDISTQMSLEDEIYFICNTINSILTQPPINYTSLRNVLYNSLGLTITLSTYQMAYIINKITYFTKTLLVVKYRYDYMKQKVKKSEKFLKQNIDILRLTLGNILQNIEDLEESLEEFKEQNINQPVVYTPTHKENTEEGTRWIITLFDTYLKYGGKYGVSSMEFFNSIKDFWAKFEDEETIELSYITDKILGGYSIEHIAINLRNWLRINLDALQIKYKYIIRLMA